MISELSQLQIHGVYQRNVIACDMVQFLTISQQFRTQSVLRICFRLLRTMDAVVDRRVAAKLAAASVLIYYRIDSATRPWLLSSKMS